MGRLLVLDVCCAALSGRVVRPTTVQFRSTSSILPSGGKLLCQLFGDIFGVEVVWFVAVDGFLGRGGGLTGVAEASAFEDRSGQESRFLSCELVSDVRIVQSKSRGWRLLGERAGRLG